MQGDLSDLTLLPVLDLVHACRQTGTLEVESEFPYAVSFLRGEIVNGGVLDWHGPEALYSCPILPDRGTFHFIPQLVEGQPIGAYENLVTEWARLNDEWTAMCALIGSPSSVYMADLPLFDELGGISIRAAATQQGRPVLAVAQEVAAGVQQGTAIPMNGYEWFDLVLHPDPTYDPADPVTALLDGHRTLSEVIANGQTISSVRTFLIGAIQRGLRFPGCGWVLRDLIWETVYEQQT